VQKKAQQKDVSIPGMDTTLRGKKVGRRCNEMGLKAWSESDHKEAGPRYQRLSSIPKGLEYKRDSHNEQYTVRMVSWVGSIGATRYKHGLESRKVNVWRQARMHAPTSILSQCSCFHAVSCTSCCVCWIIDAWVLPDG
jgi:hypothetical protein